MKWGGNKREWIFKEKERQKMKVSTKQHNLKVEIVAEDQPIYDNIIYQIQG